MVKQLGFSRTRPLGEQELQATTQTLQSIVTPERVSIAQVDRAQHARDESAQEPRAALDFRTLLQRVCDDAGDAGHAVALDIGDDAVPYNCRPVALRRAVSNLIDNAVKYGRQARVSLAEEAEAILVTIEDDGPGIPEDRREDVFKPFHRLEESRSRETGGTGLGLTVARTIVRAHGGKITLSNRDKGGLKVDVRLPR